MARPIFNEEMHAYTLGGYKLPSVTQILSELILVNTGVGEKYPFYVSRIDRNTMDQSVIVAAGDRGSAVHKSMEFILKGVDFEYPDIIGGAVENLRLWVDEHKPTIIAVEEILASEEYHYAGTLDIFCQIGKELWLVDVKTGLGRLTGPQTAAYEKLWREETGERKKINRAKLYVPLDGSRYRWLPQTNKLDWKYFESRLFCHQMEASL